MGQGFAPTVGRELWDKGWRSPLANRRLLLYTWLKVGTGVIDHDPGHTSADLLRGRGFSAITTHDEGRLGASSTEQLAYAAAQGRALLTCNRADFEALTQRYRAESRDHFGVILARRYSPYNLVRRLMRLPDQVTADEMKNRVLYI